MKKFIVALLLVLGAVVTGFAFAKPHQSKKFQTLYYFQFSGGSYVAVTLPNSEKPPESRLCDNKNADQCDGGFPSTGVTVVNNGNGTSTWTPNGTPSQIDFRE